MDRKLADTLEKNADLMKTPFIQNEITERILEKTGGEGLYNKFTIDLSVAHTDEEYFFSGDRITVEDVDDAVTIKLNSRKNDPIDLQLIPQLNAPITKFYITNVAGSGELKLLCGSKGMFEAKKKLNFINLPTYIVKPSGSYFHAYDDTGSRIKTDTDFADLMNALLILGGDNTHIFIKPPPTGVINVTDSIEIPLGNTGVTLEGGGFKWYTPGVVLTATNASASPIIADKNTAQAFTKFIRLGLDGDEGGVMSGIEGIQAHGQDSQVIECSLYDCGGTGYGISTKTNVWIDRCWIEKCNKGIKINGANEFISKNIFWENTDDICGQSADVGHFIQGNRTAGSDDFIHAKHPSGSMDDWIITGNRIYNIQNYAFHFEKTAFDRILIANNICDGHSATDYFIFRNTGTGTITNSLFQNNIILNMATGVINSLTGFTRYDGNIGYVAKNCGASGVIADGATIAHGLVSTPTCGMVNGTVAGEITNITGADATNITVAIKNNAGAAGTNQVVYWRAWI